MSKYYRVYLFLLRIALGWLFLYSGITKIINPKWTAAGYLQSAKTFSGFYHWLASPSLLPVTNFINEWGMTLVGAFLILGVFVRISSFAGAVLMFLYYLPILTFPYVAPRSYLVDEHIVYALSFLVLGASSADQVWALQNKYPLFRK